MDAFGFLAIVSAYGRGIGTGVAGYKLLPFSLKKPVRTDEMAAPKSKSEVLWKITRIGLAQCRVNHVPTFLGFVSWRNMPRLRLGLSRLVGLSTLVCLSWLGQAHGGADFERLITSFSQRWGGGVTARFTAWQAMLQTARNGSDLERLKRVNDFFNRQIRFGEDAAIWSQPDYWATPLETLGLGAGDCEDFSIAKYYSLKEVGIAPDKLRLIYVRAKTGSTDAVASQAHMVLAYYAQPEAEPVVLDNLISDIRPASRRPDLVPVFSFNSEGVFTGVSGKEATPAAGTGRLSRWEDLLKRARAEGFE